MKLKVHETVSEVIFENAIKDIFEHLVLVLLLTIFPNFSTKSILHSFGFLNTNSDSKTNKYIESPGKSFHRLAYS